MLINYSALAKYHSSADMFQHNICTKRDYLKC